MSKKIPEFELTESSKRAVRRNGKMRLGGYGASDPDPIEITNPSHILRGEQWRQYVAIGRIKPVKAPTTLEELRTKRELIKQKSKEIADRNAEISVLKEEQEALKVKEEKERQKKKALEEAKQPKGDFEESAKKPVQVDEKGEPTEPIKAPARDVSKKSKRARRLSANKERLARKASSKKVEAPDEVVVPEAEELEVSTSDNTPLPSRTEIRSFSRKEAESKAKMLGIWDDIEGTGKDGYRNGDDIESALLAFVAKSEDA